MITAVRPSSIRLSVGSVADAWRPAIAGLAATYGLRIAAEPDADDMAGQIVFRRATETPRRDNLTSVSTLEITASDLPPVATAVTFADDPLVPTPFRGRTVKTNCAQADANVPADATVLASAENRAVWTSTNRQGIRQYQCWMDAHAVRLGNTIDLLSADSFCNLLPLIEWFRSISDWHEWQHPGPQACFMFDDPNLHSPSYGFLRFAELAAEGASHNYHSAVAIVPFDCYHASRRAVRIVQENPATLSLLVHGNNHSKQELAARPGAAVAGALMHQAIQRITHFESRTGLAVSRVMAPPHGPCSAEMMAAMRRAGFEAITISAGSVRAGNPDASWLDGFGTEPAANIAGLQVIPRFPLDANLEVRTLIAAYFAQPIVIMGHHWDLAQGMDVLTSAADFINRLGAVRWMDLTGIARTNYRQRVRGNTMEVRSWGVVSDLALPPEVNHVRFESAPPISSDSDNADGAGTVGSTRGSVTELAVPTGTQVRFVLSSAAQPVTERLPRTPVTMVARRLLTEARDRAMPLFGRPKAHAVNRS